MSTKSTLKKSVWLTNSYQFKSEGNVFEVEISKMFTAGIQLAGNISRIRNTLAPLLEDAYELAALLNKDNISLVGLYEFCEYFPPLERILKNNTPNSEKLTIVFGEFPSGGGRKLVQKCLATKKEFEIYTAYSIASLTRILANGYNRKLASNKVVNLTLCKTQNHSYCRTILVENRILFLPFAVGDPYGISPRNSVLGLSSILKDIIEEIRETINLSDEEVVIRQLAQKKQEYNDTTTVSPQIATTERIIASNIGKQKLLLFDINKIKKKIEKDRAKIIAKTKDLINAKIITEIVIAENPHRQQPCSLEVIFLPKIKYRGITIELGSYKVAINSKGCRIIEYISEYNISTFQHPHARDNGICFGDGLGVFTHFLENLDIPEAIMSIGMLLSSYNRGGAYMKLGFFLNKQENLSPGTLNFCLDCPDWATSKCITRCPDNGKFIKLTAKDCVDNKTAFCVSVCKKCKIDVLECIDRNINYCTTNCQFIKTCSNPAIICLESNCPNYNKKYSTPYDEAICTYDCSYNQNWIIITPKLTERCSSECKLYSMCPLFIEGSKCVGCITKPAVAEVYSHYKTAFSRKLKRNEIGVSNEKIEFDIYVRRSRIRRALQTKFKTSLQKEFPQLEKK